jgi:hypothetical protein
MLYSYNGAYPTVLPDRIRLSNGTTRTNKSTFTAEEIADAGYVLAPVRDLPYDVTRKKVAWDGNNWTIEDITEAERQQVLSEKRTVINNFINSEIYRLHCILYVSPGGADDTANDQYFNENISVEDRNKILNHIEEWKKYLDMENPFDFIDEPTLDIQI